MFTDSTVYTVNTDSTKLPVREIPEKVSHKSPLSAVRMLERIYYIEEQHLKKKKREVLCKPVSLFA